ncbi:Holliday junction resolvase-like protein [Thermoproteota archaeon]
MNKSKFITQLKSSNLYAECQCGGEFKLSKTIFFDGLGEFPEIAENKRKEMLEELNQRIEELKRRKISAGVGAEKKAIEVGIGKIVEKVIPAYKKFGIPLNDCRPLFEPIDFLVFNGLGKNNVSSLTFLEIKTGNAQLNKHERMIRDAVDNKKVVYKEI